MTTNKTKKPIREILSSFLTIFSPWLLKLKTNNKLTKNIINSDISKNNANKSTCKKNKYNTNNNITEKK